MNRDKLSLKWGSIQSWDFPENTQACQLLDAWLKEGVSLSAIAHRDTPTQKKLICQIIDALEADTVRLDWEGRDVSKEEAKKYVMEYGTGAVNA